MKSEIYLSDKVQNKERHPAANPYYYPARVYFPSGEERVAMFTLNNIHAAIKRAEANPEDIPQDKRGFWAKLFGL